MIVKNLKRVQFVSYRRIIDFGQNVCLKFSFFCEILNLKSFFYFFFLNKENLHCLQLPMQKQSVSFIGKTLMAVESARDLGVYIDLHLTYDTHISHLVSSCLDQPREILF